MYLAPRENLRQIALALLDGDGAILEDTDAGVRIKFLAPPDDQLHRCLLLAGALPVPVDTATGLQSGGPVYG
jgi:hypothetical protein